MNQDPDRPVSVARCNTVAEADILKIALEEHGIESSIDGASLNTTFGPMAGPMISAVKLIVRQEDADEAVALIRKTRDSFTAPLSDPWFCGECLEEVEGGFELCWSCQQIREDVEAPFPKVADAVEILKTKEVDTEVLGRATDNPYESPRALGVAEDEEEEELDPEVAAAESQMILGLMLSAACMVLPVLPGIAAVFVFASTLKKRRRLTSLAKFSLGLGCFLLVATHVAWLWIWKFNSTGQP